MVSEFSSSDANDENAAMVDRMGTNFLSWTIWAYYTKDPAGTPTEGLLVDDSKPGSESNAKQPKLDAIVAPYPQAIAGTPGVYAYDRATETMTLTYRATPVPGARLATGALTQIFVPARHYSHGYTVTVSGAPVVSGSTSPWVQLLARRGASVSVRIAPATNSTTQLPLSACPLPSGRLTGNRIGALSLGMTRTQAGAVLETFGVRTGNYEEHCLFAAPGIGAGYLRGRVAMLLTANPRYALAGIRPGARFTAAAAPIRVGSGLWYVIRRKRSVGLIEVSRGVVQDVGIASLGSSRTTSSPRRLLTAFARGIA
jgi:hypothetical protein